jgi:hypothetical protein
LYVDPQLTVLVLHDTPPSTATGVQPVPMGTLRPLRTTLRSGPSRLCVAELRLCEFSTFWQHCAEPVGEVPEPVGTADTAPTRARAVMKTLENMVAGEVVRVVGAESGGCGSSSLERHSTKGQRFYMRRGRADVMWSLIPVCTRGSGYDKGDGAESARAIQRRNEDSVHHVL